MCKGALSVGGCCSILPSGVGSNHLRILHVAPLREKADLFNTYKDTLNQTVWFPENNSVTIVTELLILALVMS